MSTLFTVLAAAAALATAHHPELRGAPQLKLSDAHHATLTFAADPIPRNGSRLDAKLTFPNGHVGRLRRTGTHGGDAVYSTRVSSSRALQAGRKYTVTFRLGDSKPVRRLVKGR
jgi:hypothetical protein